MYLRKTLVFRFKIIIANAMFDYLAGTIGIDQNSWYRTGIVSKPKKLVSPITTVASLRSRRLELCGDIYARD